MSPVKPILTKLIYAFLISVVLFQTIAVPVSFYLLVLVAVWLLLLLYYGNKKNGSWFVGVFAINAGTLAAYVAVKALGGGSLTAALKNGLHICLLVIYGAELLWAAYLLFSTRGNKPRESKQTCLPGRKYDVERILYYLKCVDMIGINAAWGSGKTFVLEQLVKRPEIQSAYEIIWIDLLTCNMDEIEQLLLNELERILTRYGIFSKYAGKLRRMLEKGTFLKQMQNLLFPQSTSLSEAFAGFGKDVRKLEKGILVIYEDLDRISNPDTVKKLFSISEKLAGGKIKVIYQYEEENLKKLGFERDYLEKYIPYIVNLTEMKLQDIAAGLWEELNMASVGVEPKDIEHIQEESRVWEANGVLEALGLNGEISIRIPNVSVRKVKEFLTELKVFLRENPRYRDKAYQKTVINFLFLKHFYYEKYRMLTIDHGLVETMTFQWKDKEYTLPQLLAERERQKENSSEGISEENLHEIFRQRENVESLALLMWFGYHFDVREPERNRESIANEAVSNLLRRNENERKDHIIWNMLCSGKSEYSDMEHVVNRMAEEVLAEDTKEARKTAWRKLLEDMSHETERWRGTRTIFRWGLDDFLPVFQAFRVCGRSPEEWIKLLDFYFEVRCPEKVSVELTELWNYCDISSRKVYMKIISQFNQLEHRGNMNRQKGYRKFLKTYLRKAMEWDSHYGFDSWKLEFENEFDDHVEWIVGVLGELADRLRQICDKEYLITSGKKDLAQIIVFIENNMAMLTLSEEETERKPQWKWETKSVRENQADYDYLVSLMDEPEKFKERLEEHYLAEKINPHEAAELQRKFSECCKSPESI